MASNINTNLQSLTAQRNLAMSQSSLATSMQRLSSGLRINSAKDDAAGLAISDRFTTQIRGLNQASRNANDGISLAQTGEGALAEMTNNLQRIRELAVQAANSTNSVSDRAAIDLEVQERIAEIDRSASQTSFNGQKILDGTFGSAVFQVGANAGETIGIDLKQSMRTASIGATASVKSASSITGALATGGSVSTGAITPTDFSVAGSPASSGKVVISPATRSFGTDAVGFAGGSNTTPAVATTDFSVAGTALTSGSVSFNASDFNFQALVAGKSAPLTVTSFDNDGASAQVDGYNIQTTNGTFDFSGAGLAQFDVTIGGNTVGITLNADYTNMAGVAAAIQAQVQAGAGDLATTTVAASGNDLTFTNVGNLAAVEISNEDVNAGLAGLATSLGQAGVAANAAAAFEVNGTLITMSTDSVNIAGFAADLTTAIQGSGLADAANYSAAVVGGAIVITHAGAIGQVDITAANAKALASGITNATGVAGTAASAPSSLTIDGIAVELDQNYGSYSNMAAAISTQLGGSYVVTADANGDLTTGDFKITRTSTGAASLAIDITGDAASDTAGITTGGVLSGTGGTNLVASTNANFTVGATNVSLTTNLTNRAGVLAELQSQLSGYNVTDTGTAYKFTSLTDSAAVVVSGADAGAILAGFTDGDGTTPGTAGTAAVNTTNAAFTIAGVNVSLEGDYATFDEMAAELQNQMNGAAPGAAPDPGTGDFTVTNNAGEFTISRTAEGLASTAVSISVADSVATAAGFATSVVGTPGADEVLNTNATFKVDGQTITLDQNDATLADVVDELNTDLTTAFGAGAYTATVDGTGIKITNNTLGSGAVAITAANANAVAAGIVNATGTAGTPGGEVTVGAGALSITSGSGTAVDMTGVYATSQKLADAINANVSGVYASIGAQGSADEGKLLLSSATDITLAGGGLGLTAGTVAADQGSLNSVNVKSVIGANQAINAIDSALTTVSTMRSKYGAIQNRFDSVIASLSTASENAAGARSRIQDADFAAETANLSRSQILQQAGTAMVAQANQLPQGVLALLR